MINKNKIVLIAKTNLFERIIRVYKLNKEFERRLVYNFKIGKFDSMIRYFNCIKCKKIFFYEGKDFRKFIEEHNQKCKKE